MATAAETALSKALQLCAGCFFKLGDGHTCHADVGVTLLQQVVHRNFCGTEIHRKLRAELNPDVEAVDSGERRRDPFEAERLAQGIGDLPQLDGACDHAGMEAYHQQLVGGELAHLYHGDVLQSTSHHTLPC